MGDAYKNVEERILGAIQLRFSLPVAMPAPLVKRIKLADRTAAFIEATHLAGFSVKEAESIFGAFDVNLRMIEQLLAPVPSQEAESRFLDAFRALEDEISGVAEA